MQKYWVMIAVSLGLTGCQSGEPDHAQVDQSTMCIATTDEQAMKCPEGELFMARLSQPDSDLRAYNALNTAALYCDTNHPIFDNPAGVICVMTHQRISALTGLQSETSMSSATAADGPSSTRE